MRLDADSRPRLARKARLRRDPLSGEMLLVYPEAGLLLNRSAARILAGCDGRTVAEIAASLGAPVGDVLELLRALEARALVKP